VTSPLNESTSTCAFLDVVEIDGAVHGFHVHMRVGDIANIHVRSRTFQADVSVQFLCMQRAGAGMQGDAGIGWNQDS